MDYGNIIKRLDGTYEITYNGLPYHVISEDPMFADVEDYATANPSNVTLEQPPEPPTLAEAKEVKLAEIRAAYADYDTNGMAMTSLGFPIQIGQAHCTKLDGAVRFAEKTNQVEIYITDANDETHYHISLPDANTVLIEQMTVALMAHAHKQELRTAVENAETVGEVETIAITWPE